MKARRLAAGSTGIDRTANQRDVLTELASLAGSKRSDARLDRVATETRVSTLVMRGVFSLYVFPICETGTSVMVSQSESLAHQVEEKKANRYCLIYVTKLGLGGIISLSSKT